MSLSRKFPWEMLKRGFGWAARPEMISPPKIEGNALHLILLVDVAGDQGVGFHGKGGRKLRLSYETPQEVTPGRGTEKPPSTCEYSAKPKDLIFVLITVQLA